jgi:hypothetical protein
MGSYPHIFHQENAMEPSTPAEDLEVIVGALPYWMTVHGAFMIERLKKFIEQNGGQKAWKEIRAAKQNS